MRFMRFFFLGLLCLPLQAGMESAYKEGLKRSSELKSSSSDVNPNSLLEYKGMKETTADITHLEKEASQIAAKDQAAQMIVEGNKREHFNIDAKTDPLFVNAKEAQTNPLKTSDLQIGEIDKSKSTESLHTCLESANEVQETCRKYLYIVLKITPEQRIPYKDCGGHKEPRAWGTKHVVRYCGGCRDQVRISPKKVEIIKEEWVDQCGHLEKLADEGVCRYVSLKRSKDNETRTIQGEPITRPLFEEERVYACYKPVKGDCNALRSRGCVQVSSKCLEEKGGICLVYAQTYKCTQGKYNTQTKTVVGTGQPFCLVGGCHDASFDGNDEFLTAMSKLSLMREMEKNKAEDLKIFTGEVMECSKNPVDFKDCCSTCKGWGMSLNLAGCSSSEKDLAQRRNKKLCVMVGTYCAKKVLGVCLSKRTRFCCFPSKMSRIFQEQGRSQLRMGFGSPEFPLCRGFTPEELQRMNFDTMDLSELFIDIQSKVKMPDTSIAEQALKKKVKTMVGDVVSSKHKETK